MSLAILPALIQHMLPQKVARVAAHESAVAVDHLALDPGTRMVAAARELLARSTDNQYMHVPDIEPSKGIFHADCSELIDYLTQQVDPKALTDLPLDAGHPQPRAQDYYAYLHDRPDLAPGSTPQGDWAQVGKPAALQPGDVIAWKNPDYVPHQSSTGHVMLVSELPKPVQKNGAIVGYDVPIIDSTSHGHGPGDTRAPGQTGLGQGTVYFPVDAQGAASGFSWTRSGAPNALPPRPPMLAFGRLLK
ncbi:MAG TPA: hypothetical protein V6D47_15275 [Oscillatoriaceae cyanobacterium]